MTIMLVGGGSGGHITPLLAVAKRLKSINPSIQITAISEKGGKFAVLFEDSSHIDKLQFIFAGKLRRFHGEKWTTRLMDTRRNLLNILDIFRLGIGLLQSIWLLARNRPDIIFIKGGYVGIPVGLGAWLLRIPYITHDSDAIAGLSNRVISRGARSHAVGMPAEFYRYPAEKTEFVGIPVADDFYFVTPERMAQAKVRLGFSPQAKVLLITGGSNGAQRINQAIKKPVQLLLERFSDLVVIHQLGQGNEGLYDDISPARRSRIRADPFFTPLSEYSAAADVVITRAGATTLAEFAAQAKACVVVPNPYLTGGHQLQNALALAKSESIIVLSEQELQDSQSVKDLLGDLLDNPRQRKKMGLDLQKIMPAGASDKLAQLLLQLMPTGTSRDD